MYTTLIAFLSLLGSAIFTRVVNEAIDAIGRLERRIATASEEIKGLTQRFNEINQTFEDSQNELIDLSIRTHRYISKLEELEAQGLQSADAQREHAKILENLEGLFPDVTKGIDGCTDALHRNIDALIESQRATNLENKRSALFGESIRAHEKLTEAINEVAYAQNGLMKADQAIYNAELDGRGVSLNKRWAYRDWTAALEQATANQDAAREAVNKFYNAVGDVETRINDITGAWDSDFITAPSDACTEAANLLLANQDLPQAGVEKIEETQAAMLEAAQSSEIREIGTIMGESVVDGFTSVDFSMLPDTIASTLQDGKSDILDASNKIVDKVEETFENLEERLNITGVNAIQGFVEGMSSQSNYVETTSADLAQIVPDTVNSILRSNSPSREMEDIGKNAIQGLINGINSKGSALNTAMELIANDAVSRMRATLQINSPSRVMRRLGGHTMDGYAIGLEKNQKKVHNTIRDTANAVKDGLNLSLDTEDIGTELTPVVRNMSEIESVFDNLNIRTHNAGVNAMLDLQAGLLSRQSAAMATAGKIANNAANIISRSLYVNTPSYAMLSLGRKSMQSFAHGMEQEQKRVRDTIQETICMMQDGLGNSLNSSINGNLTLTTTSPDIKFPHIHSMNQSQILEKIHDAIEAGKHIVLDSGELVGATYPHFDSVAGQTINYNSRWGR